MDCWIFNNSGGGGNEGELGGGDAADNTAVPVQVFGITNAVAVAAGDYDSCAVLADGRVDCWGDAKFGALRNPDAPPDPLCTSCTSCTTVPVPVVSITNATAISAGTWDACAVMRSGQVDCWGAGENGELGNGAAVDQSTPVAVSGLRNATVVSLGGFHSCALLAGGQVDCWGEGGRGELGIGFVDQIDSPAAVLGLH